jgi:putative transposase
MEERMPRANRFHLPGHAWHITHRCHRREFLLKFARDRRRWRYWLFQARKRYGLCVLSYIVTSNHIHLLVLDRGKDEIARSMQLIAGRTAQEYNQRKQRRGAFWEDRYHATAVDTEGYLARCMVYIDLNMVRAGVVTHPAEWEVCGYQELRDPSARYRVVDFGALMDLLGIDELSQLQNLYASWINEGLSAENSLRDSRWTESLAVGSKAFVEQFQSQSGSAAAHRKQLQDGSGYRLCETAASYNGNFGVETGTLSAENTVFLDDQFGISVG